MLKGIVTPKPRRREVFPHH